MFEIGTVTCCWMLICLTCIHFFILVFIFTLSVPQVGFEPTIAVFEWAETVHALDRAGAVTGLQ
jgi:hypothetical protein